MAASTRESSSGSLRYVSCWRKAAHLHLCGLCRPDGLDGQLRQIRCGCRCPKFKRTAAENGDSITQAASAAELGKSVKAGLPNMAGELTSWVTASGMMPSIRANATLSAPFYRTGTWSPGSTAGTSEAGYGLGINLGLSNPIYGNSNTVTTEGVRLRHFVVLASAQNSVSVFDWSNYMAGLAARGKSGYGQSDSGGNNSYCALRHAVWPNDQCNTPGEQRPINTSTSRWIFSNIRKCYWRWAVTWLVGVCVGRKSFRSKRQQSRL